MKTQVRQQLILSRLRADQREWKIADLAGLLRVSALTIRRDLDVLSRSGTVLRTSGGCLAVTHVGNTDYQRRVACNFDKKAAIGQAAAQTIRKGASVLISDGSTTFHLASRLGQCGSVAVYTNSIAMIGELSRFSNVDLYIVGGRYDADMFVLGGSLMERVLETIAVDIAFVGADAIGADGSCLAVDHATARMVMVMMRRARRKILLADDTKVAVRSSVVFARLADFDLWITTPGIPRGCMSNFHKQTKIKEVQL